MARTIRQGDISMDAACYVTALVLRTPAMLARYGGILRKHQQQDRTGYWRSSAGREVIVAILRRNDAAEIAAVEQALREGQHEHLRRMTWKQAVARWGECLVSEFRAGYPAR